ncbi:TonB-dependent receptor domain-containing protein [Lewinella sp. IMCC34191]|uniref:TonB-dependent receptor n=1 Tax=Lewinella sp. IMCC34191 TaxID=2259172 RepID=UPI0018E4FFBD|nr:TonB-dependent receptor [Lewinella sp. IMCC34191]
MLLLISSSHSAAQGTAGSSTPALLFLEGQVVGIDGLGIANVAVSIEGQSTGTYTDEAGTFELSVVATFDTLELTFSRIGYGRHSEILVGNDTSGFPTVYVVLESGGELLDEVVVSGTLQPVTRSQSPVSVEVYGAEYFRANPSPSVFESLQTVNGVRPQFNCNVCNTGDIHINGLEGPYTMVLIDGMPIVSGLSTVYGLTGIPQSMIDRIEVVKGPASTLYGSEAVGGLINVITKRADDADRFSVDVMGTSYAELNTDVGFTLPLGKNGTMMTGLNYFTYQSPRDRNGDNFTDVTLQDRVSVFNKWNFHRRRGKELSFAARYVYEDRQGGELEFDRRFRGGDRFYGESIYTNRWELFGTYDLPLPANVRFTYSLNGHYQNSTYGTTIYQADQLVGFGQLTYRPLPTGRHDVLAGLAYRYTAYDDNTVATKAEQANAPSVVSLPGAFVQDQIKLSPRSQLLLGIRGDRDSRHGGILTPRVNYKWSSRDEESVLRLSLGNGYRVANVFTEDHAALTGARQTVFAEALLPETSWNVNANFIRKVYDWKPGILSLDASVWLTHFTNRILPDYQTDPNKIIYANLDGYAISRGGSLNADLLLTSGVTARMGVTLQDVYSVEDEGRQSQFLTEKVSGVWTVNVPLGRHWQVTTPGTCTDLWNFPSSGRWIPGPRSHRGSVFRMYK